MYIYLPNLIRTLLLFYLCAIIFGDANIQIISKRSATCGISDASCFSKKYGIVGKYLIL